MTTTQAPASASAVEFWFDPSCPWAWMTSRWLTEVSGVRGFDVTWRVMSLAMLNEGRDDLDDEYRTILARALRYTRVVAAAGERHGGGALGALYTALGTRIHLERRADDVESVIEEALAEAGLDADLAAEADRDRIDPVLRASHDEAIERVGQDVGTPVIAVDGVAFFGPVVSPAPTGDEALALWDGVRLAASYPGFFELKRSRTVGPILD